MRQSVDSREQHEQRSLRQASITSETKLFFHADGELLRKAHVILSSDTFRKHTATLTAELIMRIAQDYLKQIGVKLE